MAFVNIKTYACTNLYACDMATKLDEAQGIRLHDAKCGICGAQDLVLKTEASDLVQACTICNEIRFGKATPTFSAKLQACRQGQFCPYCNCAYTPIQQEAEPSKNANKEKLPIHDETRASNVQKYPDSPDSYDDVKIMAALLKVFMGDKSISSMQKKIRNFNHLNRQGYAPLNCDGIVEQICNVIERMEGNLKKELLIKKIKKVLQDMKFISVTDCLK